MLKQTFITISAATVVLALAGCGSASPTAASSPTPTPTPANPNVQACKAFEFANNALETLLYNGKGSLTAAEYAKAMKDGVNDMDKAGLAATGAVQQRINDAVSIIPAGGPRDMMLTTGRSVGQQYNAGLERVSNACSAENAAIRLTPLTLAPDFG